MSYTDWNIETVSYRLSERMHKHSSFEQGCAPHIKPLGIQPNTFRSMTFRAKTSVTQKSARLNGSQENNWAHSDLLNIERAAS
jgi:hypothetical protein